MIRRRWSVVLPQVVSVFLFPDSWPKAKSKILVSSYEEMRERYYTTNTVSSPSLSPFKCLHLKPIPSPMIRKQKEVGLVIPPAVFDQTWSRSKALSLIAFHLLAALHAASSQKKSMHSSFWPGGSLSTARLSTLSTQCRLVCQCISSSSSSEIHIYTHT